MGLLGKRASVVGLGREGIDLARFLVKEGADVLVTDAKPAEGLTSSLAALAGLPIRYALGAHPIDELLDAEVVYVSPGVAPDIPPLAEARRRGVPLSTSTRLFFERCAAPIVGITGSSGKTTTTALVGKIFEAAGRPTFVGGNIGVPLLSRLDEIGPRDWVILELSSFQLESLEASPAIAAITNITPNHLDRHASMDEYATAKENIIRYQTQSDWAILNADDAVSAGLRAPGRTLYFSLEREVEGAFLDGDRLAVARGSSRRLVCEGGELRLRGRHNVANALAACAVASAVGISINTMREAIRTFSGVRHRLELVDEISGIRYVNDSIATSPERSMAALEAFAGDTIILLAGGRDKHLPMQEWGKRIAASVRDLVLFGEAAPLVERAALEGGLPSERIHHRETVLQAVRLAHELARPGAVVLLSPGGTSYDQYRDFEERGVAFAAAARSLHLKAANER